MKLALDIFCGSGSFGAVAKEFGYDVISVDCRRRKGVCEPIIKADLLEMCPLSFSALEPTLSWYGLPCDIWSNASGGFHLDESFKPKTKKAEKHLDLLFNVLSMISLNEGYWVIENPRGKLERFPPFIEFLKNHNGNVHHCTLSSYGFPTTKPTMIATNIPSLELKPLDAFGRGAKNKVPGTFKNMTKAQRQQTPKELIRHILKQIA